MEAKINVTDGQIRDLLCNAFEGGSNYWYCDAAPVYRPGVTHADVEEGGRLQDPNNYYHWTELLPTIDGCGTKLRARADMETTDLPAMTSKRNVFILHRAALNFGIQVMAEKYPQHFADWMSESDDASTGDCFLQCCLFGCVVFG